MKPIQKIMSKLDNFFTLSNRYKNIGRHIHTLSRYVAEKFVFLETLKQASHAVCICIASVKKGLSVFIYSLCQAVQCTTIISRYTSYAEETFTWHCTALSPPSSHSFPTRLVRSFARLVACLLAKQGKVGIIVLFICPWE